MSRHRTSTAVLTGFIVVAAIGGAYFMGRSDERAGRPFGLVQPARAAESPAISPVKARPRDAYFPNSEDLRPDEMRVIACGTGMPTARPSQAAACFLVELGNGDKFLFDIGTGSAERIAALQIPYDYLDKVFLGHLHTDHFGDHGLALRWRCAGRTSEAACVSGGRAAIRPSEAPSTRWITCERC